MPSYRPSRSSSPVQPAPKGVLVRACSLLCALAVMALASAGCGSQAFSTSGGPAPLSPAITSLSPASAVAGSAAFSLTVTGSNFTAASVVDWNGSPRATTETSSTQLLAGITASDLASAGSASVTVQNSASSVSTSAAFSITAAPNPVPALTSVSPSSLVAGSAGAMLTLSGTGFIASSQALLNGTVRPTTYVSATTLTVQLAAADLAATGTAAITVSSPTPGGGVSSALSVAIVNPAPTLSAVSPASATAGNGALSLTLTGSNFVPSSQALWNGSVRATTYVSPTSLTAQITAADLAAPGSANVTVANPAPGGGTSSAVNFVVASPAPVLSSLAPANAIAGGAALSVTVTGSSFTASSTVQVNGSARPTTYVSATQLTTVFSAADLAAAGTLSIVVTTPAPGGGTSSAVLFTVANPAPTLSALTPASAPAGTTGLTLTVTGTNFVATSQVLWNGAPRATSYTSATSLSAQIASTDLASAGTSSVSVSNPAPGGGASALLSFAIVTPAPVLTSISPSSVLLNSAAVSLTLTGSAFTSASSVQFNGSARATAFVSATTLTAQLTAADAATAGTFSISVTTPAPGGGTSSGVAFTVNNPLPVLNAISPASAPVAANPQTLTLTGSGFVPSSQVNWNGVPRAATYLSSTTLTTELGLADFNTPGTPAVTVTTAGPGGGTSGSQLFTIPVSAASFSGCTDVDINIGSKPAGSADSFNYCYTPVTGDFQMIARINQPTSPATINGGAKVGVMVRLGTGSNARHEMIYINASTLAVSTNRRQEVGAVAIDRSKSLNPPPFFPYYVRLQRYGDLISLDYSSDGTVFQSIESIQSLVGLPAAVDIGFAVTSRTTSLLTATFDQIALTPLSPPTQPVTSWFGNTFGGGGSFMVYRGQALATDANGDLLLTGQGEEESADFLDTSGNFITYPSISHYNTDPGIAWDPKNSYVWMSGAPFISSGGTAKGGVSYQGLDGVQIGSILQTGSGSKQTAARTINGLAIYGNVLYALDAANQTTPGDTTQVTVHTVNLAVQPFVEGPSFNVPAGATYMAADANGNLWIIFTGTSPYVAEYDVTGKALGPHMSGFYDPRGIAIDPNNHVYVTDYDVRSQQIFVFDNAGNTLGTLGAAMGILSTCNGTAPGQVDPCKLDHPEGIAFDSSGNLYVASSGAATITFGNSGLVLRKYLNVANNLAAGLSSTNLAWHREGLEYTDTGSVDPSSEVDIYDNKHHFKMDYSKPAGQGWSLYGTQVDDLHYPADPRLTTRYYAGAWVRYINGQKFLAVTDEYGQRLDLYRFQTGSEITIPYATFIRETDRGQKDDASTIWVDANLNGIVDPGETLSTAPPQAASPSAEYLTYFIDATGDVWTSSGTSSNVKLLRYKMTVGANGYPLYTATNVTTYNAPSQFLSSATGSQTSVLRIFYNPTTDTMYLGGYTAAMPKPNSGYPVGALGTQVLRYDNFTGAQTLGCTITVPPVYTDLNGVAGTGDATKAMDVSGNLIAVETDFSNRVVLYSNQGTCPQVTTFTPGPEVGGVSGTLDSVNTFMMYYRGAPSNEYLIFSEEGGQHKVIMYRYTYP
jgi:hypothetical protein